MDPENEDLPQYEHIYQNEFSYRKHKKQKEEDIAICVCKFDFTDPDSACGERCLNVLTSTECTPGYCPCGVYCKNQLGGGEIEKACCLYIRFMAFLLTLVHAYRHKLKFQKCQYARTTLFKTEGRGWGVLAAENIKAGQFIIEYCGEVISWKEAKRRAQTYENQGLKDAFIISLNASESIDATKKGSLARFINHSCQPNCETRKWYVLGELRVGIFAKQDISPRTELAYDYNFEWYGGAKVRCLCGATKCSGFLGAKSRGFQEDTYLWEDDDERYSVDKIPLYDSAEDEPAKKLPKTEDSSFSNDTNMENDKSVPMDIIVKSEHQTESTALVVQPIEAVPMDGVVLNSLKTESTEEIKLYSEDAQQTFPKSNAMISRIKSNSACRNYHIKLGPMPKKKSQNFSGGKSKNLSQKQVDAKRVVELLASSKDAQEEVLKYEEMKNDAASELASLYNEIRPVIEEHERDTQDSVSTSVAEKWIEACCLKLKTEFDLYSSIVKNILCTPKKAQNIPLPIEGRNDNDVTLLEY